MDLRRASTRVLDINLSQHKPSPSVTYVSRVWLKRRPAQSAGGGVHEQLMTDHADVDIHTARNDFALVTNR